MVEVPNEAGCAAILREVRWGDKVTCPHCQSEQVRPLQPYKDVLWRYICRNCGRTFNDKTLTVFDGSKLTLQQWFTAIQILGEQPQPSTRRIREALGVSHITARRVISLLESAPETPLIREKLAQQAEAGA